jgi:hypothetical protein
VYQLSRISQAYILSSRFCTTFVIKYAAYWQVGDDIRIERNAEVFLNYCKNIGLAVNTGKTKYMKIGRNRGVIANEHIKIGSNSYEKVKTFKYLGFL